MGSFEGTQPRSVRFKMSTQASSQADGPLIYKNERDLGCEAGQTIAHASPAQSMEVDESSVSSCAGLPAIPVNDHLSPMSNGVLPRASQWLEDLTSHGLTRGTLQIRPSSQEMGGVVGSVQWLWVAQALGFTPIWFVPKDPESERIASALWPTLHLSLSRLLASSTKGPFLWCFHRNDSIVLSGITLLFVGWSAQWVNVRQSQCGAKVDSRFSILWYTGLRTVALLCAYVD